MTDALCRTIMHLTDERDALAAELAALKRHQGDTSRSLAKSATATAAVQQERDEALATISRVWAVVLQSNAALVVDKVRKALEPAQDAREGTSKATEGETGSELHPRHSLPAAVESKVGTNKADREAAMRRHPSYTPDPDLTAARESAPTGMNALADTFANRAEQEQP